MEKINFFTCLDETVKFQLFWIISFQLSNFKLYAYDTPTLSLSLSLSLSLTHTHRHTHWHTHTDTHTQTHTHRQTHTLSLFLRALFGSCSTYFTSLHMEHSSLKQVQSVRNFPLHKKPSVFAFIGMIKHGKTVLCQRVKCANIGTHKVYGKHGSHIFKFGWSLRVVYLTGEGLNTPLITISLQWREWESFLSLFISLLEYVCIHFIDFL